MKNIKTNIFCIIIIATVAHENLPDAAGVKAMEKLVGIADKHVPTLAKCVDDAGDKIVGVGDKLAAAGPVAAGLIGACVAVYGAVKLYPIGKEVAGGIRKYYRPNNEEMLHDAKIEKEYEFFKAEKAFRLCLQENKKSEVGNLGYPSACQDKAELFAMAGGHDQIKNMTAIFNMYLKKETYCEEDSHTPFLTSSWH